MVAAMRIRERSPSDSRQDGVAREDQRPRLRAMSRRSRKRRLVHCDRRASQIPSRRDIDAPSTVPSSAHHRRPSPNLEAAGRRWASRRRRQRPPAVDLLAELRSSAAWLIITPATRPRRGSRAAASFAGAGVSCFIVGYADSVAAIALSRVVVGLARGRRSSTALITARSSCAGDTRHGAGRLQSSLDARVRVGQSFAAGPHRQLRPLDPVRGRAARATHRGTSPTRDALLAGAVARGAAEEEGARRRRRRPGPAAASARATAFRGEGGRVLAFRQIRLPLCAGRTWATRSTRRTAPPRAGGASDKTVLGSLRRTPRRRRLAAASSASARRGCSARDRGRRCPTRRARRSTAMSHRAGEVNTRRATIRRRADLEGASEAARRARRGGKRRAARLRGLREDVGRQPERRHRPRGALRRGTLAGRAGYGAQPRRRSEGRRRWADARGAHGARRGARRSRGASDVSGSLAHDGALGGERVRCAAARATSRRGRRRRRVRHDQARASPREARTTWRLLCDRARRALAVRSTSARTARSARARRSRASATTQRNRGLARELGEGRRRRSDEWRRRARGARDDARARRASAGRQTRAKLSRTRDGARPDRRKAWVAPSAWCAFGAAARSAAAHGVKLRARRAGIVHSRGVRRRARRLRGGRRRWSPRSYEAVVDRQGGPRALRRAARSSNHATAARRASPHDFDDAAASGASRARRGVAAGEQAPAAPKDGTSTVQRAGAGGRRLCGRAQRLRSHVEESPLPSSVEPRREARRQPILDDRASPTRRRSTLEQMAQRLSSSRSRRRHFERSDGARAPREQAAADDEAARLAGRRQRRSVSECLTPTHRPRHAAREGRQGGCARVHGAKLHGSTLEPPCTTSPRRPAASRRLQQKVAPAYE